MNDVRHIEGQFRFQTGEGEERSVLDYQLHGDCVTILHTFVPPASRGSGVAAALTKAALEWVKDKDLKLIPACSYAAAYIKRHPDYRALLQR